MKIEIIEAENYCESVRDGTHDTPRQVNKGYKLVTAKHIINGQIDLSDAYLISESDYLKICERSKVDKWDVLMSMIGNGLGKSAVVKDNPKYAIKNLALFKIGDEIKAKWLHYYLSSYKGQSYIYNSLQGSGQPFISLSVIRKFPIPVPVNDLLMKRIVMILSRYDSLIENYQWQIKLLEEAAQRLYKEWFIDLHFPGHENTPIIDGIPEGWEKKKLGEVFTYVRGKSYTSKELSNKGTIMVNLKNIQAFGGYNRNAEKRFTGDYKEMQALEKGDLIMGVTDMTKERRLVGHVALVPDFNERATFSMDLIKIVPFELPKVYLYCAMRFGGISTSISPLANGVNVLHLKPDALTGIEMIVPNKVLIQNFSSYASSCIEEINNIEDQIRNLTEARDRLLPKLMSGEIEVS